MIHEIDKIPHEVYVEAEKYGVSEALIETAVYADRDRDGILCDNWILVTKDEIVTIGGINLIVPDETKTGHRIRKEKLRVVFGKISVSTLRREDYTDFKTETLISGCIVTAFCKKTEAYEIITYITRNKEEEFIEFCDIMNPAKPHADKEMPDGMMPAPPPGAHHGFGGGPGGPGGPGGHHGHMGAPAPGGKGKKTDNICPKCGRKYPNPITKICPHCTNKASVVKRLLSFVYKYKASVILILVSMGLMSILSVISPYISSEFFYDKVLTVGGKFYGNVLLVIGIMVSLKVLTLLVEMVSNIITAKVVPKIVYDLKKTIFLSIEKLSLGFFTNRKTGSLMNQVNGDANSIYWFFVDGLPYLIINVCQTVGIAVIMFVIEWRLALITLAFMVPLIILSAFAKRKTKMLHSRNYSAQSSLSGLLADVIGGARVVKAFSKEKDEIDAFNKKSENLAKATKNLNVFSNLFFPSITFLVIVASVAVLGVGGWFVMKGDITYGKLLAFTSYSAMLSGPLMFFVNIVDSISNCFNATYRLMEVMDAEPEVCESNDPVIPDGLRGDIEFCDVSFGYDKTRKVIEDVSFKINAGEKIGIVGHTGAGKSTIANLLIRLYDVSDGRILIDGNDVRDLPFSFLRDSIAIVSQETYMFQGTILDNIKYAKPDATYEEIITAAKISGAHDFIMKLPDAYQTKLGFGSADLSGGEKQRVSIARALLRDPKILILDEATAAMDTRTESAIQDALDTLSVGRTTLMIAHRLSTLRDCDRLIAIKHGKLEEMGTHAELIQKKGLYYKLYTLQYEALKNAGIEE